MEQVKSKNVWAWFLAAVLYCGVYGYNLQIPTEVYYDEVYFVKTAKQIIHLSGYMETSHPPFGKLLVALSILIFGDHSWAWRIFPFLAGFGCLVMVYEITRILTKKVRPAFLATLLFSVDGVSFTQARIAMLNAPMFFFMLLSVWCFLKHSITREWPRPLAFILSGIFLGLAVGTRLTGVTVAAILLIFYGHLWREDKNKFLLIEDTIFFLMLPSVAVYFSTFLIIPFIKGFGWNMIWKLQKVMFSYHLHLKVGHLYGSEWWTWPLMTRPIWYYFKMGSLNNVSMARGIFCIGNPAIFWVIPTIMFFSIVQLFKEKSLIYQMIVIGFFTQWLQWAPMTRVKFFHYIYTAMPFVTIALALFLDRLWEGGKLARGMAVVYLLLVIGMFIYWYPLLNGMLVPETYFRQHMWFSSWI